MSKIYGLDCEMVEVRSSCLMEALARVSIMDVNGICVLDKYVRPIHPIIDYRTKVSGITAELLHKHGEDFYVVQAEVKRILDGCIVVGHSLEHDFAVLNYNHPARLRRDTAYYSPFRILNNCRTPKLTFLAKRILGVTIQTGAHDSKEDAMTALKLYLKVKDKWEALYK